MITSSDGDLPGFADAHYSIAHNNVYNTQNRLRVARQLHAILNDFLRNKNLRAKVCLDVGCSTGIITNYFATFFKRIEGVDVDPKAVAYAKRRFRNQKIHFRVASGASLPFPPSAIDVVICNQTLAFVRDQKRTLNAIYRVLKPGGICLLTIDNYLFPIESGYKLPFLQYLPYGTAINIVHLFGHTGYYLNDSKTLWDLHTLCKNFYSHDYTLRVLVNPHKYHYVRLYKYQKIIRMLPKIILNVVEFFVPSFVFVLEKPQGAISWSANRRRPG